MCGDSISQNMSSIEPRKKGEPYFETFPINNLGNYYLQFILCSKNF
jgi:hypothetical protein